MHTHLRIPGLELLLLLLQVSMINVFVGSLFLAQWPDENMSHLKNVHLTTAEIMLTILCIIGTMTSLFLDDRSMCLYVSDVAAALLLLRCCQEKKMGLFETIGWCVFRSPLYRLRGL